MLIMMYVLLHHDYARSDNTNKYYKLGSVFVY